VSISRSDTTSMILEMSNTSVGYHNRYYNVIPLSGGWHHPSSTKLGVLVSFKMTLGKPTLLKQSSVSVLWHQRDRYYQRKYQWRSRWHYEDRYCLNKVQCWFLWHQDTKVSVTFKMTLWRPTLFKQSAVLVSVTSTTPTLVVLKPMSVG
jgi:hypothetical protein